MYDCGGNINAIVHSTYKQIYPTLFYKFCKNWIKRLRKLLLIRYCIVDQD